MQREGEKRTEGQSTLVSRNITVMGRRTSVRLEPEMWTALREIARRENCKIHDICTLIQMRKNPDTSLTAAIRVFLMLYYRAAATEEGHSRAGHGSFQNMIRRARMGEDYARVQSSQANKLPRTEIPATAAENVASLSA
jgi:predicted DNA-binding ribbon-helix-helix protein